MIGVINRKYYLVLLYVLFVGMWDLAAFSFISSDVCIMLLLALLVVGPVYYHFFSRRRSLFTWRASAPILWIMFGIFLSMFMAYIYSGQAFVTSLLAYKAQYLMLGGLSLLIVAPTRDELIGSLKIYAILFTVVYAIRFIAPGAFVVGTKEAYSAENRYFIPGYEFMIILLYWYMNRFAEKPTGKKLLCIVWLLAIYMLLQNRTTLIPVALCILYLLMKVKSRYRGIIIMGLSCLVCVVIALTIENWMALYDQSVKELSDPKYNRILALNYFLFEGSKHLATILFGNGFISANTSSLMSVLMDKGIYNSDMGFLGYWNQFGLIPIFVFVTVIIKTLRGRENPMFVKFYAFQILMCSPTVMYFGQASKILCFILLFYLFEMYRAGRARPVIKARRRRGMVTANQYL